MAKVIESYVKAGEKTVTFVDHFKENWQWWLLLAAFIFTCSIGVSLIRYVNSDKMFEQYDKYVEQKHICSNNYRMETAPIIRNYLNQLVLETGADRAYISEFHNGKNNPSGLQWQYADMNFINDVSDDVRDEFQNVSLVKYPLAYTLYKNGYYVGTVNDIEKLDVRMSLRLKANDVYTVGAVMMYGSNLAEIGFVGVSYTDSTKIIDEVELSKILYKYASKLSPLLDVSKAKKQ